MLTLSMNLSIIYEYVLYEYWNVCKHCWLPIRCIGYLYDISIYRLADAGKVPSLSILSHIELV